MGVAAPSPSRCVTTCAEPGAGATGGVADSCHRWGLRARQFEHRPRGCSAPRGKGRRSYGAFAGGEGLGSLSPSLPKKNQSGGRGPPAPHHAHRSAAPLRVALPIVQPGPASRVKPGSQGAALDACRRAQASPPCARVKPHAKGACSCSHFPATGATCSRWCWRWMSRSRNKTSRQNAVRGCSAFSGCSPRWRPPALSCPAHLPAGQLVRQRVKQSDLTVPLVVVEQRSHLPMLPVRRNSSTARIFLPVWVLTCAPFGTTPDARNTRAAL